MSTEHTYFLQRNDTSRMIEVFIRDNAGKPVTGITPGNVNVSAFEVGKSEVSVTAVAVVGDGTAPTYESNKFVEVDNVNKPGLYKYSIPDAVLALTLEQVMLVFEPTAPASANPAIVTVNLSTEVVLAPDGLRKVIIENGDTVGAINAEMILRGMGAVLMGTLTGADSPQLTFRGVDRTVDRVIMTTDTVFNRTAVTVLLAP